MSSRTLRAIVGGFFLLGGAALAGFALGQRVLPVPFPLPEFYRNGSGLWSLLGITMFGCGWAMLRTVSDTPDVDRHFRSDRDAIIPPAPTFQSLTLYTREGCGLCDEAKTVLARHADRLPPLREVNIAESPQLTEQFGNEIPVVKIDGQVRFRGRISEVLLVRLLDHGDLDDTAAEPGATP